MTNSIGVSGSDSKIKFASGLSMPGGIYVVSGAVFDKNGDGQRDADDDANLMSPTNRVSIPTHFYKIILHVRPSGFIDTITILLPHTDQSVGSTSNYLLNHISTIDEIEK